MYIRVKSSKLSPRQSVQIVRAVREGKRVLQQIVQHVGIAHDERQLEELKTLAQKLIWEIEEREQRSLPGMSPLEAPEMWERDVCEGETAEIGDLRNREQVIEGPKEVVESLFSSLGLEGIFGVSTRGLGRTNVLKNCLACALANPASKRGMSRWLGEESAADVPLGRIYRMLDGREEKSGQMKRIVARESLSLSGTQAALMLFDVTTLYFESFTEDEMRKPGYSKDNKISETQVVLALAVTPEGYPLWYEVFPGNTFEGKTLLPVLGKCMKECAPEETVVVADRAMFARINLEEIEEMGCSYVIAAKLKVMDRATKAAILDESNYAPLPAGTTEGKEWEGKGKERDDDEPCNDGTTSSGRPSRWCAREMTCGSAGDTNGNPGKRTLLVTWSEGRARKDARDREKLLKRMEKKLGSGSIRGSRLITNRGTGKYLTLGEDEKDGSYVLDREKIEADAKWDGLHGVITNLPVNDAHQAEAILTHYGSLWRIEESFRIGKHDLKIRPIYHWTERRIRGHLALCYLAYALLRRLQHRLEVRQRERMSAGEIRKALRGVQATLLEDTKTGKMYRLPKEMSEPATKIYKSLGLKRPMRPTEILSMQKYRNRKSLHVEEEA